MTEAGYIAQGDMALKERNWKVLQAYLLPRHEKISASIA